MPGQAIAFYTTGDTRRLGSLPTAGGGSAASGAGRNDTETVSNVYRRYASALAGDPGRAFGVRNTRGAIQALESWMGARTGRGVSRCYFIGHANREYSWQVRIGAADAIEGVMGAQFLAPISRHHGPQPTLRRTVDLELVTALTRSMGDGRHALEFRACYFSQAVLDNFAVAFDYAARDLRLSRFQLELRGYENYYAIIPSGRRFRSEIHSRGAGDRVLAFANGTRAPDAELHACVVRGGGFIEGAACP